MRKLLTLVAVGVLFSGLGLLRADEKGKTITIKGDGLCAKCGLKDKDAKKCQNAVIVTKDGKKTTYYLTGKLSDEVHKSLGFCGASKESRSRSRSPAPARRRATSSSSPSPRSPRRSTDRHGLVPSYSGGPSFMASPDTTISLAPPRRGSRLFS